MEDDDIVTSARGHARAAWALFTNERNLHARLTDWQTSNTPDGTQQVSARVHGPGAEHALRRFTAEHYIVLGCPGDLRQAFDYTQAGRTVCVWRTGGVWVELWHSDQTEQATPTPAAAPGATVQARRGLGGRLPYFRTRRKETRII